MFSKAKIQRFNDIKPCAPNPAKYHVTVKEKVKGVLPPVDSKSSISDTGSTHSTPCIFRTPTLLKRKKTTTSVMKSTPKELFSEELQILKEKIVECENKDAFIKDLQEQVDDFKDKMSNLEKQKNQLHLDKVEFEKRIIKLNVEYKENVKKITETFEYDINKAHEEKIKVNEELVLIKKEHEELREANRIEMEELKKNCDLFQELYNKSVEECNRLIKEKDEVLNSKDKELKALEENCFEIQRKYSVEIEKLQKEHQNEIQDIEFEMLKTMTELQKEKENAANKIREIEETMKREIRELQKSFEEEKGQLLAHTETRIKQIEENFRNSNLFTEAQVKEKLDEQENTWKNKLKAQEKQSDAILKECQAISEYNIIQCELEKNEAKTSLAEKTKNLENVQLKYDVIVKDYEELNKKFKDIQNDLSKVIVELNDTRKTLGQQVDNKTKELKKLSDEKRAYEVTIKNSQITIDVLTRRLIHSDKDVEQLKKELSDTEAKTLEYESKCIQLTNDLKQSQMYNEELDMQYESTIKLNTSEIHQLKSELLKKVDAYKTQAEASTKKLLEEKATVKDILQQLHEAYSVIDRIKSELEYLGTVNSQYEFDSEQTQNELEDYRIREMDWNNQKEKLENIIKEMENLLEIKQDEVGDLQQQLAKLREKNDSLHRSLDYYKGRAVKYEVELDETAHIHRKYIEQSGKYDELLLKFEQLEMENLENKNKCLKLSKALEEKGHSKERNNRQTEKCTNKKTEEHDLLKERLDNTETERDGLLVRVDFLENELRQVSKKYADLVGHTNNKQKIKHLLDLKAKNEELLQNNMDLELKVHAQQKSMEKLKKENSELRKCLRRNKVHTDDKENVGSPNRSLNSSRIESPFRERN